jgi:hypothetical protein
MVGLDISNQHHSVPKMTTAGQILVAMAALLVVFLGGGQLVGPHLAKYRITDDFIEYTIGGLRVWKSPLDEISDIQIIPFAKLWSTPSLRLMNRPFARYVLVTKRRGIFRAVILTPDDPQEFVKLVRQKIRPTS